MGVDTWYCGMNIPLLAGNLAGNLRQLAVGIFPGLVLDDISKL